MKFEKEWVAKEENEHKKGQKNVSMKFNNSYSIVINRERQSHKTQ